MSRSSQALIIFHVPVLLWSALLQPYVDACQKEQTLCPDPAKVALQLIQGRRGAEALAMPGSSNIIILWYKDTNGKKPRPNAQRILSATKDISIQTVNS